MSDSPREPDPSGSSTRPDPAEVTRLLQAAAEGDAAAAEDLLPLIYAELHSQARRSMRAEPAGHTLQPTALVHEAWMRLVDDARAFGDRQHFYALCAKVMRQVLVDHARARRALKRGGDREREALDESSSVGESPLDRYLAIDEALRRLVEKDAELARIAELHLFGGLQLAEIATTVGLSTRRTERAWRTARAFLSETLSEFDGD